MLVCAHPPFVLCSLAQYKAQYQRRERATDAALPRWVASQSSLQASSLVARCTVASAVLGCLPVCADMWPDTYSAACLVQAIEQNQRVPQSLLPYLQQVWARQQAQQQA